MKPITEKEVLKTGLFVFTKMNTVKKWSKEKDQRWKKFRG